MEQNLISGWDHFGQSNSIICLLFGGQSSLTWVSAKIYMSNISFLVKYKYWLNALYYFGLMMGFTSSSLITTEDRTRFSQSLCSSVVQVKFQDGELHTWRSRVEMSVSGNVESISFLSNSRQKTVSASEYCPVPTVEMCNSLLSASRNIKKHCNSLYQKSNRNNMVWWPQMWPQEFKFWSWHDGRKRRNKDGTKRLTGRINMVLPMFSLGRTPF